MQVPNTSQFAQNASLIRHAARTAAVGGMLALPLLAAAVQSPPAQAHFGGSEFVVNSYTTSWQLQPEVATDANGNYVIVWQNVAAQDGSGMGNFGQRYDSTGAAQGGEFQVNTYTTGNQSAPEVAMDDDGDFVVVWTSDGQDGDSFGIFGQRYNSAGSAQGGEFMVNSYTTGSQKGAALAMDDDGDFVVTWESSDDSLVGVFARRFNSVGTAQGGEFLVNTETHDVQASSTIAMDSDGDFIVAWQSGSQDGENSGIFGQRFNNSGTAQGGEFQVNTYTTNSQVFPAAAMDSDGDFVIAWQSLNQDGSANGIYAQRFNSTGTAQGGEFRANDHTTGTQSNSKAAMDSTGGFILTWQSENQDGELTGVFAKRYDSAGTALEDEFQVNTYTTSFQQVPGLAVDANGDFIITWEGGLQDGDGIGIIARQFEANWQPPTATPTPTATPEVPDMYLPIVIGD